MRSIENHTDRAHSELGASSASRWMSCSASVPLSRGREGEDSVYAKEGTAAHELAEHCLTEDIDAKECIGLEFNGFEVTEEMAEAVQVYVDYVRSVGGEGKEIYLEERFSLDHISPGMFGTNDCAVYDPFSSLTVIDLKYGKGIPVEVEGNKQLRYYALGAARNLDCPTINLVIVQPRCEHPDGPIRVETITYDELLRFEEELREAVSRVKSAEGVGQDKIYSFAKSGDHCRFCNALPICKLKREESYSLAQAEFSETKLMSLPEPEELTSKQLVEVLEASKRISVFIDAVASYAHKQAELGVEIPGFKLVQKKANRKWKDEKQVMEEFEDLFGEKIYVPKKLKSPAQIEKIVGKGELDKFTFTPETGSSLVPDSDKRKAISPKAVEEFADI